MDKSTNADRIQLLCLPHAGGSTPVYYRWSKVLADGVEVVPIEYAGHGTRIGEPVFDSIEDVAREVLNKHADRFQRPYALFGHSMGALAAFEISRHLRRVGGRQPDQLFASAFRAPHLPLGRDELHRLSDAELITEVAGRFLEKQNPRQRDLIRLMLPVIRADLRAIETWDYGEEPPFDFPILAMGGSSDAEVGRPQLEAWRQHTTRSFAVKTFPGGHFYHEANATTVPRAVARRLLSSG